MLLWLLFGYMLTKLFCQIRRHRSALSLSNLVAVVILNRFVALWTLSKAFVTAVCRRGCKTHYLFRFMYALCGALFFPLLLLDKYDCLGSIWYIFVHICYVFWISAHFCIFCWGIHSDGDCVVGWLMGHKTRCWIGVVSNGIHTHKHTNWHSDSTLTLCITCFKFRK